MGNSIKYENSKMPVLDDKLISSVNPKYPNTLSRVPSLPPSVTKEAKDEEAKEAEEGVKGLVLKSLHGGTSKLITFVNGSGNNLLCYWLDYDGNEVFYFNLNTYFCFLILWLREELKKKKTI
jgi:glutathione synthase/RimK-type ligase-like ATP-grasp enzyme